MENTRVRFAPSPTGELHIGGVRTALFNWLFTRNRGGRMILRIDDTDKQRSSPVFLDTIIRSMQWLGLNWDEGPQIETEGGQDSYFQSERQAIYEEEAQRLLDEKKAYYCFCTAEELQAEKERQRRVKQPPRYSGRCRNLTSAEREKLKEDNSFVIRLLMPQEGTTVVRDLIRGEVTFDHTNFDDFIIVRSDGLPTYNFASVVDDYKMGITHVIRAEEHLSNTPRQQILAQRLGYNIPQYAHVPMILAPDHSKLSKRHGATSVQEYRKMGILPEALINYLALLGWSPGDDREIMTIEEMIELFSLEKVSRNPAIFDLDKLIWLNGHYLRTMELQTIAERARPFFQENAEIWATCRESRLEIEDVIDLVRDRVKTLREIVDASTYFYLEDFSYDEKGTKKHFRKGTGDILKKVAEVLEQTEPFTADVIKKELQRLSKELKISPAKINLPVRLAVTGRTMGPDLFDIISLLGKEKVLARFKKVEELFFKEPNGV
ncbi:MAG: glutamate--tRNA ligase [Firmicutes bacterium]|nr:glutamate--tRNA ligase [Bacillota bacterium]